MTSAAARVADRALAPEAVVLATLEIVHPDVPDPIRVVADGADRVVDGQTYRALPFRARLVDDPERGAPRAEIALDNVGAAVTQWVELSRGGVGATATIGRVVAGEASHSETVSLEVASMRVTTDEVVAEIGYEPLLGRAAVRLRYDAATAPGLF